MGLLVSGVYALTIRGPVALIGLPLASLTPPCVMTMLVVLVLRARDKSVLSLFTTAFGSSYRNLLEYKKGSDRNLPFSTSSESITEERGVIVVESACIAKSEKFKLLCLTGSSNVRTIVPVSMSRSKLSNVGGVSSGM